MTMQLSRQTCNTDIRSGSMQLHVVGRHEINSLVIADRFNDKLCDARHIKAVSFTQVETTSSLIGFTDP